MRLKFNWGTGIFIFIIIFLSLAITFIIFSLQFDTNLVHEDYYEKGVNYTEQIEIIKRSIKYSNKINIDEDEKEITISTEDFQLQKINKWNIHFFRPSDKKKDYKIVSDGNLNKIVIVKDSLSYGRYIVKISWEMNNEKYLVEKECTVH